MSMVEDYPRTLADLLEDLGGISPERLRLDPLPGTARQSDVVRILDHENRRYELVDRVLVSKGMGFWESFLAMELGHLVMGYLDRCDLGFVTGMDGGVRLRRGIVRFPDVAFFSWERFPNRQIPSAPIPALAPDLAVEVLSASNTRKEIKRKLGEYFRAGTRLVWVVDRRARTVQVYTSPEHFRLLAEGQTLDGGEVLPGFKLSLRKLFASTERRGPRTEPANPGNGKKAEKPKRNRRDGKA